MIIYHNFQLSVSEYAVLGRNNDFPEIEQCPACKAMNRLERHSFYERNAIDFEETYRITICRLQCPDPSCNQTFSILPDFLLPYFQHTVHLIIQTLLKHLLSTISLLVRQLIRFYIKRFLGNVTRIEMYFRQEGFREVLPLTKKEKAIKLLKMIKAFGEAPFVRRYTGHFTNSFMADSVYHGTRVINKN